MTVIGMGESKTPNSFIAACNKFKYLDILSAADEAEAEEAAPKAEPAKKPAAQPKKTAQKAAAKKPKEEPKAEKEPKPAEPKSSRRRPSRSPAPACAPSAGRCAPLCGRTPTRTTGLWSARWGNLLDKRYTDFDVRNFGFSKLTPFFREPGHVRNQGHEEGFQLAAEVCAG